MDSQLRLVVHRTTLAWQGRLPTVQKPAVKHNMTGKPGIAEQPATKESTQ
jgi:hypothetical protein